MADKRISQLVDRGTVANNDVVPIVVSGAVTTNKATISSIQTFMQGNLDLGVTSVGITFGTSGTDINASGSPVTSSGNITINLPTASATNRGALSSADWTTFNSKQQAITLTTTGTSGASTLVSGTLNIPNYSTDLSGYVTLGTTQTITAQKTFTTSGSSDTMIISHGSGSGFALDVLKAGNGEAIRVQKTSGSGNAMTISGGNFEAGTIVKTGGTSSQFLKADGSVDSTVYYPNSNPSGFTSNVGTVTSVGLSSATSGVTIGSTPINTSGTITLAIATASGSQNGLLSSTDWTTFNGKQNALTNPITGTGVSGQVAFWNGTSSQTGDADFTYNSSTNLLTIGGGITLTGAQTIQTSTGNLTIATGGGNGNILLTPNGTGKVGIGTITPEGSGLTVASGGILVSLDPGVDRKVLELYATSTGAKLSSTYVGSSSYGSLELLTSGLARLTIADTGAATFSSSVTMAYGGSPRLTLQDTDAGAGNVGILFKESTNDKWSLASAGGGFQFFNEATSSNALFITSANNVGIGTASPDSVTNFTNLSINGTSGAFISMRVNETLTYRVGTNSNEGYLLTSGAIPLVFYTNTTERMRITSGGYLKASNTGAYFGSTGAYHESISNANGDAVHIMQHRGSNPFGLYLNFTTNPAPNNTSNYFIAGGDVSTTRFYIYSNGNIQNSNNSYGGISDAKLKENITDASPKLEDLLKVKVRNYNLIGEETKQIGVIAQELEEVFPAMIDESEDFEEVELPQFDEEGNEVINQEGEVVTTKERVSKGTTTKSVKYSVFVPMLIKAIQELKIEIDSLKNQIK